MGSKEENLNLSEWEQIKQNAEQRVNQLNRDEASLLGRKEQIDTQLMELRIEREGLKFGTTFGNEVVQLAQKSFEELKEKPQEDSEEKPTRKPRKPKEPVKDEQVEG